MIPTNYDILETNADQNPAEVFWSHKRYTCCNSGLKYPVMVAQIPAYGFPVVIVANIKGFIPLPFPNCCESFEISISKKPEILDTGRCAIDDRDVIRAKQWVASNYDKIQLLVWMYDTGSILRYIDNDTGITHSRCSILNSMKRIKRKTKKRLYNDN